MKSNGTQETTTKTISASEEELHRQAQNVTKQVESDQKTSELEQAMSGDIPGAQGGDSTVQSPAEAAGMKQTLYMLVKTGVGMAHEKWEWSDPGEEWKRGVVDLAAILANKYIGSMAETYSTEGALVIMVGTWVISNVQEKGVPKFFSKPKTVTPTDETVPPESERIPRSDWVGEEHLGAAAA